MFKIFIFIVSLFSFIGIADGNWYPGTVKSYGILGVTNCGTDGDSGDPAAIALNNGTSLTPHGTSVYGIPSSGTIRCLYWDGSDPESVTIDYASGWKPDAPITITARAKDRGGSRLKRIRIQESQNNGAWTTRGDWNNLTYANNTLVTRTFNRSAVNGSNFKYRVIAEDYAGNENIVEGTSLIMFDTVYPTAADVTSNLSTTSYHQATNSRSNTITVSNAGGSPISRVETRFERYDNPSGYFDFNSNGSTVTRNLNISKVTNGWNNNNYRDYTQQVNKVCDQAGNCVNDIGKDFIYHVYPSDVDSSKSSVSRLNEFTSNHVADGSERYVEIYLEDRYDNLITPVYRSNGTLLRSVNVGYQYDNDLYLNQQSESGNSGVRISNMDSTSYSNASIGSNRIKANIINDKNNRDGKYIARFRVYAPTENSSDTNGRKYAKGAFKIDNFIGGVSDTSGDVNINNGLNFNFRPVYYGTLSGDAVDNGIVESNKQVTEIEILKNSTSSNPSTSLHILKVGTKESSFDGVGNSGGSDVTITNNSYGSQIISNLTTGIKNIETLFTLIPGGGRYVDDLTNVALEIYIKYNLGVGDTVYYLGDINKTNIQSNFEKLKILGKTNIDESKQEDLISGQDDDDIHNLAGDIVKSSLKRDIRKRAISTIKFIGSDNITHPVTNIELDSWGGSNGGKALGNILYYKIDNGANVNIGNGSSLDIEGKKTLIVKGGNVRITQNIINSTNSDILGIISLKDENGNGGKVYIDTNVTELDAIIYADKSVIGYSESYPGYETDGNINDDALQNQLYVYGSIFSENTIGGSRKDPPVCPFWTQVEGITCDVVTAQKYDLNYLRSGVRDSGSNPKLDSTYEDYPVVIKYNPAVQTGPPPLFGE